VIEVHGLDVDAARRWLHACGRFAPAQIVIDGVPLRRGFEGSLAEAALEPPSTGQIAVTADETAHLWLLAKGIVSSHLTLPQAPGFEAALELASSATSCSPASLRDAVEPRLGTLVDQAVGLMLEAAATASVDEATLRTLRSRMLLAAHRGWRRAEIFRAPLLLALDGPLGRSTRRLRLVDLGAAHGLPCLAPDEDPALYRLPASPVLVLDAVERGRLAQLLKLSFRSLGRSRVPRRGLARLRHGLRGLGERLRTIATRLRHPREGHALSPSALGSQERALLDELRAAAPAGIARIALTSGGSPPRRAGDVLLLPRRNADVAAAARAVARDPRWTRAAIIALGEDVRREADRVTADP
jgi:hypothetical protein